MLDLGINVTRTLPPSVRGRDAGGQAGVSDHSESCRSILDVGGSPFALILTRSTDFAAFQQLLATQVTRPTHRRIAYSLLQTVWDPAESAGWLSGAAERSRRTGKAFLLQTARGDSQVPGVAAAVMARSLGAVTVVPALGRVYGLAEKPRGWSFNLSSLQQPSPLSPLPSSSEGHQPFFTALFQEFEYPDVFPGEIQQVKREEEIFKRDEGKRR